MSDPALFGLSVLATLAYVALRAFQQLNVIHYEWRRIVPTSILMGLGDVTLILIIVRTNSLWLGVTNGVAGALGCFAAMHLNRYLYEKEKRHAKV